MQLQDMKVGQKIDIFVTRGKYRYRLQSKVEAGVPGRVYISLITAGLRVFAFKSTDIVEVIYEQNDKMWKWSDVRAGIGKLEGNQVHYLESSKEGVIFNRRATYRVQLLEAMEIMRFTPIEGEMDLGDINMDAPDNELRASGVERSVVEVVVKDISETGIGFHSPVKMKIGDRVRVRFPSEFGVIECDGTILREVGQIWNNYTLFYGCSFTKTDNNLNKYIFAQQRLQLQKGRRGH